MSDGDAGLRGLVESFFGVPYEPRDLTFLSTIDGQVVAHVGMDLRTITVGEASLTVAGMGFVITHPGYRGQGLASTLLNVAAAHARHMGIEWAALFSGVEGFYQRLGYVFSENLSAADPLGNPSGKIKPLVEGAVWPSGVVDLNGEPW